MTYYLGFPPFVLDAFLHDPLRPVLQLSPGAGHHGFKARCGPRQCHRGFLRQIPIDVTETDQEVEIVADMPGVKKSAIHIDVERDTMTLSVSAEPSPAPIAPPLSSASDPAAPARVPQAAQQNDEAVHPETLQLQNEPEGDATAEAAEKAAQHSQKLEPEPERKIIVKERSRQFAKRTLELPEGSDGARAEASVIDGVLRITIPKHELPASKHRVHIA